MASPGRGLGTWGSLVLLILCSWTGSRAEVPNRVRSLQVESRTNSSITLVWEAPEGSSSQNLTYWVECVGEDGINETRNTADLNVTVDGLQSASSYNCSVWAEKDGAPSDREVLQASTAPNPVQSPRVGAPTNSSITLLWETPEGSASQNLIYQVECVGKDGSNETRNTTDLSVTVDGLQSASSYECDLWAEKDGVSSSRVTLHAATAPNRVRSLQVESCTNSSITLVWEAPEGSSSQNLTYWVECIGEDGINETRSTADLNATVDGLQSASSYNCSVWAEKDGAPSDREVLQASTAPNPVQSPRVDAPTNSSITLLWEAPEGSASQNLTYWVECIGEDGSNETRNTTDMSVTVDGLQSASSYECDLWAEKDGVSSSRVTLHAATAPNRVRSLQVESRTNSSITLVWEAPEGSSSQNLTYWVECVGEDGINETRSTADLNATVDGLQSASSYNCSVWAEKDGAPSDREVLQASTAPNPVQSPRVGAHINDSITLLWEAPEGSASQNLTYQVQCVGEDGSNEIRNTTELSLTFLISRTLSITVSGTSEQATSQELWSHKSCAAVLGSAAPNPVQSLRLESRTNSSITLVWEVPEGSSSQNLTYWVQCIGEDGSNETRNTTDLSITVDGLEPESSYEFWVWVEKNGVYSSGESKSFATAPNPVRKLSLEGRTNNSISLSWQAPSSRDLQDYIYWVQCTGEDGKNVTQNTTNTSVTIEALEPGILYRFSVWAEKNGAPSYKQNLSIFTAPSEVTHLQNASQTNSSVTLRWQAPADPYSQLYTYWVQWTSEETPQRVQDRTGGWTELMGNTSETWYEVEALQPGTWYNFMVWAESNEVNSSTQSLRASTAPNPVTNISCESSHGGYGVQLAWYCSGGFETFEWELGGQRGFHGGPSCNEILRMSVLGLAPAQSYLATVTTLWNGMRASSVSVNCYTEFTWIIIGVIVGVLLFLILVFLLFYFLKKRNKKPQKAAPGDLVFVCPGSILAQDFADHVRKNEKDSNCGFAEEYQQLALEGHSQAQRVALAPENKAKNRYRNVLPYDWSRVPLQPLLEEPGSDYINASFMPGLRSPREFIAAQGPLPHTVGDFWRLVWEQKSHTLVMLTNCVESGRVKCEHYWPLDAHPCTHGDLQVTLVDETVMENWTVRDLQLFHVEEQKALSVRQFHYMAWPDHGVPYPDPLLAFWKMLRQWLDQSTEGGPPIVHCSAGVGRTGTLIALDVLLRQLQFEGRVGPLSFVKKMRESRPLMVQTENQYVFLHQCILRFLQLSASAPTQTELIYENVAAIRGPDLNV